MEFWLFVVFIWLIVDAFRRRNRRRQQEEERQALLLRMSSLEADVLRLKKAGVAVAEPERPPLQVAPLEAPKIASPAVAAAASSPSSPAEVIRKYGLEAPAASAPSSASAASQGPAWLHGTEQPPQLDREGGMTAAMEASAQPAPPPAQSAEEPPVRIEPPAVPREQAPPEIWHTVLPPSSAPAANAAWVKPAPPRPRRQPLRPRLKSALALEETLGTNWLNKLGIVILVFGVVFYLGYQFGGTPSGKVFLGYLGSFAGLGFGVWLEKRDRYRVFARSCIGGGWALLFSTTYAMYHVPAARVLDSQGIDLALMLVVAAGMVAHSLRYRSQVVTGLAFILGFSTVTISHVNAYSLAANAILAMGLVIIVVRMRWFELEVFGILAAYFSHLWWLHSILAPMGESRRSFPEFTPSTVLLFLYWSAFRASYVWRKVRDAREEHISTLAALLNTSLLLALLKYQSIYPEWAFWAVLVVGVAEFLLGQLPAARRRRQAFVVLTVVGAVLLVAAFPFRYSGGQLSVLWLMESQALFLAGLYTREIVFRRLGLAASAVAAAQMAAMSGSNLPPFRHGVILFLAALVFYVDAHLAPWRWREVISSDSEKNLLRPLSYVAGLMAVLAVWCAVADVWIAAACCAIAAVLSLLGRKLDLDDLAIQGPIIAALGFVALLNLNIGLTQQYRGIPLRLLTIGAVAALLYLSSPWTGLAEWENRNYLRAGHIWGASFLVALLVWYQAPDAWIAVGWLAFGLALAILGRAFSLADLSFQAHALATVASVRILQANLWLAGNYHGWSRRLVTVSVSVVILYAMSRWSQVEGFQSSRHFRALYTATASFLVALLIFYELQPAWVAVGWAVFALALKLVGRRRKLADLAFEAHMLAAAVFIVALAVNLQVSGSFRQISLRLATVSLAGAALYVMSGWSKVEGYEFTGQLRPVYTWAASILLVVLSYYEAPEPWLASVWMMFAVILAGIGRQFNFRDLIYQANVLALLAAVRAVMVNLFPTQLYHHEAARLATVSSVVALLYLLSRWSDVATVPLTRKFSAVHTWAASVLLALLAWYELSPVSVVPAWTLLALGLFQAGLILQRADLRFQGYAGLLAAFVRIQFVNLNAAGEPGTISPRVYTILPLLLALYYVSETLWARPENSLAADQRIKAAEYHSYFGTFTLVALLRCELDLDWVIAGWAAVVLVLLALAWRMHRRILVHQAILLSLAVFFRAVLHNLYERSYFPAPFWHSPFLTVGATATLLFLALPICFQWREHRQKQPRPARWLARKLELLERRPEQLFFYLPLLLVSVLLAFELRSGRVTLAFGVEGVAVFLLALWAGERSYRLTGLILLLLCVGKILLVDAWRLEARDRYLTLIVLGSALLLVSFLYTRYREAIRQYL